jgi:hypothetical protein
VLECERPGGVSVKDRGFLKDGKQELPERGSQTGVWEPGEGQKAKESSEQN